MIVTEAEPTSLVALFHCACNLFLVQHPLEVNDELMLFWRNAALDETCEVEALDGDGVVTADGILEEGILFRKLLLLIGTSSES